MCWRRYAMTIKTRKEWLKVRKSGIGASECSAIVGMNPYMTNIQLWEYKTGLKELEDISDKPYVQYGIQAEKYLRGLFALDFPQYKVGYKDFDIVRNKKYPFIFATLDGRLIEKETGRRGVLEIKTTEILKSMQKESWKDQVPSNYFCQILWQLLATGWEFSVLKAQLKTTFGDEVYLQTKHYHIERRDVKEDLEYLQEEAIKFWEKVQKRECPDLLLPSI